jgi:hypothetical protein
MWEEERTENKKTLRGITETHEGKRMCDPTDGRDPPVNDYKRFTAAGWDFDICYYEYANV